VCSLTVHIVTVCRTDDDEIYGQDIRCNEGRVINVISATVGYSDDHDEDDRHSVKCTVNDHVICRQRTNSPEIMKCNGRRNCILGLDVFNYPENSTCGAWQRGNYIEISYNCSAGKRTCFMIRIFTKLYVEKMILL